MSQSTTATAEHAALDWLASFGYTVKRGSDIATGELRVPGADRIIGRSA